MKNTTKKVLALILSAIFLFALSACGGGSDEAPPVSPTPGRVTSPTAQDTAPAPAQNAEENPVTTTSCGLPVPEFITIHLSEYPTSLTKLDFSRHNVPLNDEDIVPLKFMVNVTELNLSGNEISDISPLSGLTKLTVLNLERNNITDISPLSGLVNLSSLLLGNEHGAGNFLGNNKIQDVSPLSNLVNLTSLDINSNNITDISPLSNLVNLTSLNLRNSLSGGVSVRFDRDDGVRIVYAKINGHNNISDISPLSNLVNLESLNLTGNNISDISPLVGLISLSVLRLDFNNIDNIEALSGLSRLTSLNLSGNYFTDISPLENVRFIDPLNVSYINIDDWSFVEHIKNVNGRPSVWGDGDDDAPFVINIERQ